MKPVALARIALVLLLAVSALSAWPRRWYDDDVFITFRYARNVANGHGIVWNHAEGAPVEGSTSLAWTLLTAAAIRAGGDPVRFAHTLGLAAALVGLLLAYWLARDRLALDPLWALAAPLLLAASRQWTLGGVAADEMRAATVVMLAGTLALDRESARGKRGIASGLLFFAATLLRPETPLVHAAIGLGLVAAGRAWKSVLGSGASHVVGLVAVTAFRVAYFGQPLPNTFYAKVGAAQFGRGVLYLRQFLAQSHAWLWLPVLIVGLLLAHRSAPPLARAFVGLGVVWAAWVAFEGGATTEFRLLDPVLPAIACLLALAIRTLAATRVGTAASLALLALLVSLGITTVVQPFRSFADTASTAHLAATADFLRGQGEALAPYLGASDRVAIGWAGAFPYVTDIWHLDTWGLNDPVIARRPFDPDAPLYHQRHATWRDLEEREVAFATVYNRFLFAEPLRPAALRHPIDPWIPLGTAVYCLRLPEGRLPYWIFASTWPTGRVAAWARERGLEVVYVEPLVAALAPPVRAAT